MKTPADLNLTPSSSLYPVLKWEDGREHQFDDNVAEEVPIAFVYNGISHAVMLATPSNLEDFALGFSLTEGIICSPKEIYSVEVLAHSNGIELHIDIAAERFQSLKARRRTMAGRTGCGLCGSESLDQLIQGAQNVISIADRISTAAIQKAYTDITNMQLLQASTGCTHASAWVSLSGDIQLVREDVGRHNALDKLIGAKLKMNSQAPGFVFTTSRASYEMVQKVASADIPILVAISAPTGLAIKTAQRSGITLIGFARNHQHVIYSCAERVIHKEKQ